MLLYGKRSVLERIKANPQSIKKIYLRQDAQQPQIISLARKQRIFIENLQERRFFKIARGMSAQGIIADVDKFQYADLADLINQDGKDKPTLLFLDRITDPQNLGSILRTCACFGNFSIVLPRNESAEINETVLKVACGAENYLAVCRVNNLASAIGAAKEEGYAIAATLARGGDDPSCIKLSFPIGLLFGSEEKGLRPGLLKHIDYKLTLPMQGAGFSFNVAMAVGIFCYEVLKQKEKIA